jgi:hypothetical protein
MAQLTDLENRVLDFAEAREQGSKARVRDTFGWLDTTYVQKLLQLIARADVEQQRPMLVHRLRRITASADQARRSRTFTRSA